MLKNQRLSNQEMIDFNFEKLHKILKLPAKNETVFITEFNGLTPLDLILFILKNEKIIYLNCHTFMISTKAIAILKSLKAELFILKIDFTVNSIIKKIKASMFNSLKTESVNFLSTHKKQFLIKTETNHYIIQSSGNLTFSNDIEFTTLQNNLKQFTSLL